VKACLDEVDLTGFPGFIVAKGLIFLKIKLKEWSKDVFGHLDNKMAN